MHSRPAHGGDRLRYPGQERQRDRREHQHRHEPGRDQPGADGRVEQRPSPGRSRSRRAGTAARSPAAAPSGDQLPTGQLAAERQRRVAPARPAARAGTRARWPARPGARQPAQVEGEAAGHEEDRHQQPVADGLELDRVERVGVLGVRVEGAHQQAREERAEDGLEAQRLRGQREARRPAGRSSRTRICALVSASRAISAVSRIECSTPSDGQRDRGQRPRAAARAAGSGPPAGCRSGQPDREQHDRGDLARRRARRSRSGRPAEPARPRRPAPARPGRARWPAAPPRSRTAPPTPSASQHGDHARGRRDHGDRQRDRDALAEACRGTGAGRPRNRPGTAGTTGPSRATALTVASGVTQPSTDGPEQRSRRRSPAARPAAAAGQQPEQQRHAGGHGEHDHQAGRHAHTSSASAWTCSSAGPVGGEQRLHARRRARRRGAPGCRWRRRAGRTRRSRG